MLEKSSLGAILVIYNTNPPKKESNVNLFDAPFPRLNVNKLFQLSIDRVRDIDKGEKSCTSSEISKWLKAIREEESATLFCCFAFFSSHSAQEQGQVRK